MAVSLATASSLVVAQLNLATTYTVTPSDPRAYAAQISDAVLGADAEIVKAILNNKNHPRRQGFLATQSAVTHGAVLTSHVGPLETVQCAITGGSWASALPATPVSMDQINWENLNPRVKTFLQPHYCLDGSNFYHNRTGLLAGGASAVAFNVQYCAYTKTASAQAPDEELMPDVWGALALLFNIEGEDPTSAQLYATLFEKELARLAMVGQAIQSAA